MKYNGIELEELNSEDWDKKTCEVLVWDDDSLSCIKAKLLGYINGSGWIVYIDNIKKAFDHCAKIPVNPIYIPGEYYLCTYYDIIHKAWQEGKFECEKINDNIVFVDIYNFLITPCNNITPNYYFAAQFKEIKPVPKPVSKPIVTNKDISYWVAKGNGECSWFDYDLRGRGYYIVSTTYSYNLNHQNDSYEPEHRNLKLRKFGETKWHEPTLDYLGIVK